MGSSSSYSGSSSTYREDGRGWLLKCTKVVKLMTRMGKMPESRPATISSVASVAMKSASAAASKPSTVKKVYCTPKINFVGELLIFCFASNASSLLVECRGS